MTIRVLAFASAGDAIGGSECDAEVPDGADVAGAVDVLCRAHPRLAERRAILAYAVNGLASPPSTRLAPADTLALLPPFSGG